MNSEGQHLRSCLWFGTPKDITSNTFGTFLKDSKDEECKGETTRASLLGTRKLLVVKGLTTRNKDSKEEIRRRTLRAKPKATLRI